MAVTIIREYGVESKLDKYNLMVASGRNLNEFRGQTIEIRAYMIVEETTNDGELVKSLKVISKEGEVIGTRSKTYISGFETYLDFMETDELARMKVVPKPTKAGRTCLTFEP